MPGQSLDHVCKSPKSQVRFLRAGANQKETEHTIETGKERRRNLLIMFAEPMAFLVHFLGAETRWHTPTIHTVGAQIQIQHHEN